MRCAPELGPAGAVDRRAFLRLAAYGTLGLVAARRGAPRVFAALADHAAVSRMEFEVRYRTEVRTLPPDAKELRLWMPLPPSDHAQEIRDLSVTAPVPYETRQSPPYGNRLLYLRAEPPIGGFTVEARYQVVRHRVGPQREPLDAVAARKYLRLADPVRVTDEVDAFARKAAGKTERPVEVGRRAYEAIIDLLTYDKQIPGCGMGDTAWVMRHKRGKCDDYHALFMAMMVSRGIPVRWEQGFPLPYPSDQEAASGRLSGDCSGAHCWVSFHDPDFGWVPVDVSEADKHPDLKEFFFGHLTPNRFQISEGRSIVLDPAQGGDPLPTFAYAYAEADGVPLIYPANYENFIRFTITQVERLPA